jgi:hypothetical protein
VTGPSVLCSKTWHFPRQSSALSKFAILSIDKPKSRGRRLAVDAESDANILAWITKQAKKNPEVPRTDVRHYYREVCKFEASRGWVDCFISRYSGELIEKKSSLQEEALLQAPRDFLDETRCCMHAAVQGCTADLVFNLDEVGTSDWEDGKPKRVVVPRTPSPRIFITE